MSVVNVYSMVAFGKEAFKPSTLMLSTSHTTFAVSPSQTPSTVNVTLPAPFNVLLSTVNSTFLGATVKGIVFAASSLSAHL